MKCRRTIYLLYFVRSSTIFLILINTLLTLKKRYNIVSELQCKAREISGLAMTFTYERGKAGRDVKLDQLSLFSGLFPVLVAYVFDLLLTFGYSAARLTLMLGLGCSLVWSVLLWSVPAWSANFEAGLDSVPVKDAEPVHGDWAALAEAGDAVAQYNLAKLYEKSGGPANKNLALAAMWYQKAAAQGLPAAQNSLGLMYAQARGVASDPKRAVELWRAAAEQGYSWAQFNLGLAYFRGRGVESDRTEAIVWFRKAADAKLPQAVALVDHLSRRGPVAKRDDGQASSWYKWAATRDQSEDTMEALALEAPAQEPEAADEDPMPFEAPALPPKKLIAKPAEAEPAPVSLPAAKPATVQKAALTAKGVAADTDAGSGTYRVWFASAGSETKAEALWQAAQARHPEIFGGSDAVFARVDLGGGDVAFRILAGPMASEAAAAELCQRLRAAQPSAFCKVHTN